MGGWVGGWVGVTFFELHRWRVGGWVGGWVGLPGGGCAEFLEEGVGLCLGCFSFVEEAEDVLEAGRGGWVGGWVS